MTDVEREIYDAALARYAEEYLEEKYTLGLAKERWIDSRGRSGIGPPARALWPYLRSPSSYAKKK